MPAPGGAPSGNSNRISTSDSLKTHDVWQKSIGHDPYAGENEGGPGFGIPEVGEINSSAKGLFRLAQLTGNSSTLAPGSCKRCGQVGHLYFNCRNFMMRSKKQDRLNSFVGEGGEEDEEEDEDLMSGLDSSSSDDGSDDDSNSDSASDEEGDDESSSASSDAKKKKKKKKGKKASKKDKKDKKSKKDKKDKKSKKDKGKSKKDKKKKKKDKVKKKDK